MSLYRAAKPSTAAVQPYTTTPKPPKPIPSNSVEFKGNHQTAAKPKAPPPSAAAAGIIIVNQDQVFPQPMPKVAFVVAERNRDSYGKLENFYGGGAAEDEAVDAKAARYISSVQERFRLERVNSERKTNYEEIHV